MNIFLQRQFYQRDVGPLFKLALPLILSGVVESSIGFFSTIFLAHLGKEALAAGALVTWLFATLMVVLWGTLTAVSLSVAQKHGARDEFKVAMVLRDGLLLAVILVVPTFLLLWYMAPILLLVKQSHSIVLLAQSYLHALAWGLLPDFIMLVLLQFLIGLGHARTSLFFILFWVPIAIFCNYIFIYGKFGLPRLGIAGIGWGTTLSYWLTTIWLLIYMIVHSAYRPYFVMAKHFGPPSFLKELLQIGLPMGVMYGLEVGLFLVLTVLMGLFGSEALAANQIVLQYLGQLIAVIFAIAQAITVRMGHQLGEKNIEAAVRTHYAGIYISLGFMIVVALCYWFLPDTLISVDLQIHYPQNATMVVLAKQFLMISAIFQLLETIRIALFGSLRAMKDTYTSLFISIISFWFIALPLGYLFAYYLRWDGAGLWWGMVIGVFCSIILMWWRMSVKIKLYRKRVG